MIDQKFIQKVQALPISQQVALWFILRDFHRSKGTWFTVPELALIMKKFLKSKDPKSVAKSMGGIMSSLIRNGMIEKMAGGRKPVWQVVPELHKHAGEYRQEILLPARQYSEM